MAEVPVQSHGKVTGVRKGHIMTKPDEFQSQSTLRDSEITRGMSRRRLIGTSAAAAGAALLSTRGYHAAADDKVELVFTYWGSPQEQEAVANMCKSFNEQHDNIEVRP